MAEKTTTSTSKEKTPTGLNSLSDVNERVSSLLDKGLSVDTTPIQPVNMPDPPQELPDVSTQTKILRSAMIFLASQGDGGAQKSMELIKQFEAQDQAARDRVQQKFANAMALSSFEFEQQKFGEETKQNRLTGAINERNTELRALELVRNNLVVEADASAGDPIRTDEIRLELGIVETQIEELKRSQNIGKQANQKDIEKGLDKGGGAIVQMAFTEGLMTPEMNELLKTDFNAASEQLAQAIREKRAARYAAQKLKATPEVLMVRESIEQRIMQGRLPASTLTMFDQLIETQPDPFTGQGGDAGAHATAAAGLLQQAPDQYAEWVQSRINELVLQYGITEEQAGNFVADVVASRATWEDAKQFGDFTKGSSLLDSIKSNPFKPTILKAKEAKAKKIVAKAKPNKAAEKAADKALAQKQMDSLFGGKK